MSFNVKNPLSSPMISESPPTPMKGTRGFFPKGDGWYDIDDSGNVKKVAKDEIDSLAYYGDPNIKPTDASYFAFTLDDATMTASIGMNEDKFFFGGLVIPHHYTEDDKTYTVTSIADYGIENNSYLKSIIIPNTVTTIGNWGFYASDSVEEIIIPDSVETIGDHAFECMWALTEITLPKNLKTIGDYAFCACEFKEIVIPDGVTNIGSYICYNCVNLKKVVIPVSVESIGIDLFAEEANESSPDVYYNGTQEQWNKIVEDKDVFGNVNATLVCLGVATKEYVDTKIGDIETALDQILVLDNELLGVSE